ncbi:DNA repair protein RadA [bacterium]|nr:DNA repair protein RadA [bacterium]
MGKVKSKFVCQQCGYESIRYIGKCPNCSAWGSFVEEVETDITPKTEHAEIFQNDTKPALIKDIEVNDEFRTSTKISEFDRVLGGGFVQGSLVLLAGDPGIGKSTLVLQTSGKLCEQGKRVLYASAEESASQIKSRAERLNIKNESLYVYSQTNIECIKAQINELRPDFLIIDSVQAVFTNTITSSAGSISQIRECCNILMHLAKCENITVIVIGHVTKEGNIAGPKMLEHMVDVVIQFEGDKYKSYRILRAIKNRFGTTSEVGLFDMKDTGLVEITNSGDIFLDINHENSTGSVVIVANEGTRPILVEIQALVGSTSYPAPRRVTNGVDTNRVLQILAVLEKRVGLNFSKQDVYVNVIGGIDIKEPAADLGVAVAIVSCFKDKLVDNKTVIIGEIGLSGEIRSVNNIEKRLIEARKLGFKTAIIPKLNDKKLLENLSIKCIEASKITEALKDCCF